MSYASVKGHLPVCEFLVGAGAKIDHAVDWVRIMTRFICTYDILYFIFSKDSIYLTCKTIKNYLCFIRQCVCYFHFSMLHIQDGKTPLLVASICGHLSVCEFLVRSGADKEHADRVRMFTIYSCSIMYMCSYNRDRM